MIYEPPPSLTHEGIGTYLEELAAMGWIEDNGRREDGQTVWVLTARGRQMCDHVFGPTRAR